MLPRFEDYCLLIANPPDIKHHRIPAPELSFMCPNLPVLIEEVERLLKA